jgi:hypothetical protein
MYVRTIPGCEPTKKIHLLNKLFFVQYELFILWT